MNYLTYLKNKNLSKITIKIYLKNSNKWLDFLNNRSATKTLFSKFIKMHLKKLSSNSIRLLYSSILSFLKYQKKWKLVNECKDIKLPTCVQYNKTVITLEEYSSINIDILNETWMNYRDWLIFSFLFFTGIRACELNQIKKSNIINNKLLISGKSNKTRIIFIPDLLNKLLKAWKNDYINVSKKNKKLTHKQLNIIIKRIGMKYFSKNISCHSLRRSYATNLLRKNVDIKTVSTFLGHSNINTTSRYIQLTTDEMVEKIKSVF